MNNEPAGPAREDKAQPPGDPGRENAIAGAIAAYIDLHAESETVDVDAFCGRYPDLEPDLRAAILTLDTIDAVDASPHSTQTAEQEAAMPERLSGFRILHEIGAGGMARVYAAWDEGLGRKVAVKVLKQRYWENEPVRTRFLREARALARLRHPHIVQIFSLGQRDELPHFVMEHVAGVPLTEASAALSLEQKVELLRKVILAVHFLHQNQIIHRDLKPSNILVGSDLEPKLLDLGLAREVEGLDQRLTLQGEVLGTPRYFSPEQASGEGPLDARSDIFSIGILMYELLTGSLPFRGEDLRQQIRSIRQADPPLPRRLNPNVPGALQNICMQALEKEPAKRYASAREMADDLERFLAGEPVLAAPSAYGRLMAEKIDQHVRELDGWRQDHILSDYEFDALRRGYDRLVEREDAWIMEVRRLSLPQVALYLGAWVMVVGAALVFLFRYDALIGAPGILLVAGAAVPAAWIGIRGWAAGRLRIAVAYLLAFCLLLPVALLVTMQACGLFTGLTRDRENLELLFQFESFQRTTNAQLWWALCLSLPAYLWLRRRTRSSVFSLVFAVMAALLCVVTLLRMGLIDWISSDPGRIYLRLLPAALLFFAAAIALERRRLSWDARYFYPIAVIFTYGSLSGIAAVHEPYAQWLGRAAPWTRGQVDYLFMINAGIYFLLQFLCDRTGLPQMRIVAKAFRFVLPGHILVPLFLLGLNATSLWNDSPASAALRREAHIFEVLLPVVACLFVLLSIPKQMKNYLGTGMLFIAIGCIRLQQNWLKDLVIWPVMLLAAGLAIMLWASRYAAVRTALARLFRRRS
jgi:tRNA A-37 threonylcarbamoyl transferase component Bud32